MVCSKWSPFNLSPQDNDYIISRRLRTWNCNLKIFGFQQLWTYILQLQRRHLLKLLADTTENLKAGMGTAHRREQLEEEPGGQPPKQALSTLT